MTLSREAEEGEPTRPSYIPEGVPWAYVTDGLGRKVGAWVAPRDAGMPANVVAMFDPDEPSCPFYWRAGDGANGFGVGYPPCSSAAAPQCAALLRGEIGYGHPKNSAPHQAPAQGVPSADGEGVGSIHVGQENRGSVPTELDSAESPEDDTSRSVDAAGSALSAGPSGIRVVCECPPGKYGDFGDRSVVVSLRRPAHMYPTQRGDVIGIDKCLALCITDLWQRGIWTEASCCGHGRHAPSVCVREQDYETMDALGYERDLSCEPGVGSFFVGPAPLPTEPIDWTEPAGLRNIGLSPERVAAIQANKPHDAAPSGELAKDEFIWRHERLSMRFVDDPGLGPGLAIVGHGIYAPEEIRRHAKRDPDPLGWPRALAFFEEHCGKTETPEQIAAQVHAEFEVAVADADAHIARVDGARPSPADGPAKVFENETEAFGHLIAGPRDWRGKQADEWLKRRGVDVEGVMLKALPRILERLPAEQAVQVMGEETRQSFEFAVLPSLGQRVLGLIEQRDEALARAEKAEANLLASDREWYAKLRAADAYTAEAQKRAEQAERERDEARLAVSAWVTAQSEMHRLALAAGKAMDDAEQKLRALVGAEVTYNG